MPDLRLSGCSLRVCLPSELCRNLEDGRHISLFPTNACAGMLQKGLNNRIGYYLQRANSLVINQRIIDFVSCRIFHVFLFFLKANVFSQNISTLHDLVCDTLKAPLCAPAITTTHQLYYFHIVLVATIINF